MRIVSPSAICTMWGPMTAMAFWKKKLFYITMPAQWLIMSRLCIVFGLFKRNYKCTWNFFLDSSVRFKVTYILMYSTTYLVNLNCSCNLNYYLDLEWTRKSRTSNFPILMKPNFVKIGWKRKKVSLITCLMDESSVKQA